MTSLLLLSAALLPAAAFEVPGFELVYTQPVETALEQPDLRQAAAVWPEMIDAARSTLEISQFYVTPKAGEPLEPTLQALTRAGSRGVKIRVLAERKMEKASAEGFAALRATPNLELRVIEYSKVGGGINHSKYFVVDATAAYVGSQNFDWRSLKHIHELGLRITEPSVVQDLRSVFEHDWAAQAAVLAGEIPAPRRSARPAAPSSRRSYLVASPWPHNPEGVGDSEAELARLLGSAEKEARIQLLDYAPLSFGTHRFYAPIDNALRLAATRGVRVKLLVSHWNTEQPELQHLKSLALLPNVEIRIATIPQASEGFIPFARVIHSKYLVVDGKALWLGTSNWAGGYLDNSRNVEVVVHDEALSGRVLRVHEQLWTSEYSAPLDVAKAYPKPRKS